jgi:hypothetical protein
LGAFEAGGSEEKVKTLPKNPGICHQAGCETRYRKGGP